MGKPITYKDAGVNIDAANEAVEGFKKAVKATHNNNVLAGIGAFGGMFQLPQGYKRPVLVGSIDGVGTKLKVAIMKERHDTIGGCLVNHCVNDIAVMGATPLFFLDYIAAGVLKPEVVSQVVKGMALACKENKCALLGGETAEMPGFYHGEHYDVAGVIIGVVERSRIMNPRNIQPGHVLIALPSAGLHTNGYSLARKLLFETAGYDVDTYVGEFGCTVGEELLKVHRSYLKPIQALCKASLLDGAAHITGGGITENTPRMLPPGAKAVIDTKSWQIPPVFEFLRRLGNMDTKDFRRTFNLGVGVIFAVKPKNYNKALDILKKLGEKPFTIGHIAERGKGSALSFV